MLEALFSKINKSEIVRRKKERGVESSFDYMEDFDEESQFSRKIFELPSEPIWYYFLLVIALYNMSTAFLIALEGLNTTTEIQWPNELFYICDMFWFVDMVLCILSPYVINLRTALIAAPGKSKGMYVMQLISVLPIEICFIGMPAGFNYSVLNRTLKIGHVIYMFVYINSLIGARVYEKILQLVYLVIYVIMLLSFCLVFMLCHSHRNKCYDLKTTHAIVTVADHVTAKGFGLLADFPFQVKLLMIVGGFLAFIGVYCTYTALITYMFFASSLHKSNFRYRLNSVKLFLHKLMLPAAFIELVEHFFDKMWVVSDGYEGYMGESGLAYGFNEFSRLLPKALQAELHTDICWGAFSHSLLFKDMPMSFLRVLSSLTKQQIYITGQYIFHLHEARDKMIYIFSGIVQVISEEDGETPLINLTDGTVIGETCVLLPRKVAYKVKCLTTCVVQELRRCDFLPVAVKYPAEYTRLKFIVNERYENAQNLYNVQQVVNNKDDDMFKQSLSMMWVNYTLHNLMGAKDFDSALKHSMQNIHLNNEINDYTFKNYLFCAKYLCLLTTNERIQSNMDTLFIRSTFPHMLKPNTGLTLFWNLFITAMALIAGIRIPIVMLVDMKESKTMFWCTVYAFTIIWCLDIIIQLRTAVQLRHRLITKPMEIFFHRIPKPMFILDLLSAIPIEFFSSALLTHQHKNFVYLNRVLKLARVFQMIGQWEKRYNSNPLTVRFFLVSCVCLYTSVIYACVLYKVECLNGCGGMEFIKLLFMTNQIITGVGMYVKGYSTLESYYIYMIILFVAISTVSSVSYGLLFSAHAFNELYRLNMELTTFEFFSVIEEIDNRLIPCIEDHVKTQRVMSNGLHFFNATYIFDVLPRPLIGYMFEKTHLHWIRDLPIFQKLPDYVIVDILQRGAYIVHIPNGRNILHVGDYVKEYIILSRGVVERTSGMTYTSTILSTRQALNDMEVTLKIPTRNVFVSHTHCELIIVPHLKMRRTLSKHDLTNVCSLTGMKGLRRQILTFELPNIRTNNFRYKWSTIIKPAVIAHKGCADYYKGLKSSTVLRYILMYFTFMPDGKYFFYWELVRSICVLISTLLYTTTSFVSLPISHPIRLVLIFFDLITYVDMYIQLHICYYNEDGILITHPLLTARRYITHGLLLDWISVIPTYLVTSDNTYIILNINRMIQLRRYIGFVNYNEFKTELPRPKIYLFKEIPVLLIVFNFLASQLVVLCCHIDITDPDFLNTTVNCLPNSVFGKISPEVKFKFTPMRTHVYAFYILINAITSISIQGYEVVDLGSMLTISVISALAFYYGTLSSARYFGHYMNYYKRTICNDIDIQHLHNFLKLEAVRPTLMYHVDNYLSKWWQMEHFNVHSKMSCFPGRIQRDVLFERFGTQLTKYCLGRPKDFEMFIRNALLHTTYSIMEKNAFILTINDVTDETIILFRGIVEIVAPDGGVLCLLRPGSILGNLCRLRYNRMFESVIAAGTCELLTIKTVKFYELLDHFPETLNNFMELRFIHTTHIPGYSKFQYIHQPRKTTNKLVEYSNKFLILSCVLLITGTYTPVAIYIYTVAVADITLPFCILAIITDLCFLVVVLNNDYGNDLLAIIKFKPMRKTGLNRRLFIIALLSLLPAFYITYIVQFTPRMQYLLYVLLRSPVLLRHYYFQTSYAALTSRMGIKMYKSKSMLIFLNIGFMVLVVTCIFMLDSSLYSRNISQGLLKRNTSAVLRMASFVNIFYISSNMFMHCSQYLYFPISIPYIILFIITVIFMTVYRSIFFAKIISIIQATQQMNWAYISVLNHLYSFLNRYEVSLSLTERVSYYAGVIWMKMGGVKYPKLMNVIPIYLREAILENIVNEVVNLHPILAKCHPDFRRQLTRVIKFDYYYHGDYIQYKGAVDNTMYWVHRGMIVSLSEVSEFRDDIVRSFVKGDGFGIPQGVFQMPHVFSYRAISATCILSLNRSDYEHLLPYFPASREVMNNEAQKMLKRQYMMWDRLRMAESKLDLVKIQDGHGATERYNEYMKAAAADDTVGQKIVLQAETRVSESPSKQKSSVMPSISAVPGKSILKGAADLDRPSTFAPSITSEETSDSDSDSASDSHSHK